MFGSKPCDACGGTSLLREAENKAENKALATDLSKILRVRCPKDTAATASEHIALDVRLPLGLKALALVTKLMGTCPCGESLKIMLDGTPALGGAP